MTVVVPNVHTLRRFLSDAPSFTEIPESTIDAYLRITQALDDVVYNGGASALVEQKDLDLCVGFIFEAAKVGVEQAAHQKMALPEIGQADRKRIRMESPAEYLAYKRDWYEAEQACKKALIFRTRFDSFRQAISVG